MLLIKKRLRSLNLGVYPVSKGGYKLDIFSVVHQILVLVRLAQVVEIIAIALRVVHGLVQPPRGKVALIHVQGQRSLSPKLCHEKLTKLT